MNNINLIPWLCILGAATLILSVLILLFKPVAKANSANQKIEIPKLNVRITLSMHSFFLLLISVVLIVPYIWFAYKKYDSDRSSFDRSKGEMEKTITQMENKLENNNLLIKEIQNCIVPLRIEFTDVSEDSLPDLNSVNCQVTEGTDIIESSLVSFPSVEKRRFELYLKKSNCDRPLNLVIKDPKSGPNGEDRVWKVEKIYPCQYVITPLNINLKK